MKLPWLMLTLSSLGCSASHPSVGGGDAGSPDRDAGSAECRPEPMQFRSLSCPPSALPGPVDVTVQVGVGTCCASVSPRVEVARADGSFVLTTEGEACDCCDACECVGPSEEVLVPLGDLAPGLHEVRAGSESCTILVDPPRPPAMCRPGSVDELRMPSVLLAGDPLAMSFIGESSGCGCEYRVDSSGPLQYDAELCDCCDECDCIDSGYETARSEPSPGVGSYEIRAGDIARALAVYDRASCRPSSVVSSVRVEPPRYDSNGNWWVVVSGTENVCCVDPTPAIETRRVGARDVIALEPLFCVETDCFCPPTPHDYEAWHNLGPLESGTHRIRVRDIEHSIDVP
jgi:hypothetical protein